MMGIGEIRTLLQGHEAGAARRALYALINVVEIQQEQIDSLHQTLNNQYERHTNQAAALRKDIERLKGTHGA